MQIEIKVAHIGGKGDLYLKIIESPSLALQTRSRTAFTNLAGIPGIAADLLKASDIGGATKLKHVQACLRADSQYQKSPGFEDVDLYAGPRN